MKRKSITKPNGKNSQEKISNHRRRDRIEIERNSEKLFSEENESKSKQAFTIIRRKRERKTRLLEFYLRKERERASQRDLVRENA